MEVGTPKKFTVQLKDELKNDLTFCALCHVETDPQCRIRLFEPTTDIKTDFCLELEYYFNTKFDLRKDSRSVCNNCRRRLKNHISWKKQDEEQLEMSRSAYKEKISIRVKRGRRSQLDHLGRRSVKPLVQSFESAKKIKEDDADKTTEVDDHTGMKASRI